MKQHHYQASIEWTGNNGSGTNNYRSYERSYVISIEHKADILGSSDPAFRGDKTKANPEDLFLSSLAACHMLWYLHLCADAGVVVTDYVDNATGVMLENANGSGQFTEVHLNPIVTIENELMAEQAQQLHTEANKLCFIANSVNFPIHHYPIIRLKKNTI